MSNEKKNYYLQRYYRINASSQYFIDRFSFSQLRYFNKENDRVTEMNGIRREGGRSNLITSTLTLYSMFSAINELFKIQCSPEGKNI
jgi:hypothetical protein